MANKVNLLFNSKEFLKRVRTQKTTENYQNQQPIFSQGDAADAMFYIQRGHVKLTVVSQRGKKAVVAVLGRGDFFGEGCLARRLTRKSTATAINHTTIARVNKTAILSIIHQEPAFARLFIAYLLSRMVRIEEDLEDQLFNSSEERLARILLLLAHFGPESTSETVLLKISQDSLAQMVGTTRSRVSHFMNKFKKLGFIEYNGSLTVHSSLLAVMGHDKSRTNGRAPALTGPKQLERNETRVAPQP